MKALYVTSVKPYSGKTAVCLALGKLLQAKGHQVGYLKPVSTRPWRTPDGSLADEDAAFVRTTLGLLAKPPELSPVFVTASSLRERLKGISKEDDIQKIKRSAAAAAKGKDVLLLEGGASLREGYAVGLSNLRVAQELGVPVLVVVTYDGEMQVVDDALTAHFRLGDRLLGAILNQVPAEADAYIQEYVSPFLDQQGITVLGALPRIPRLSALSLGELCELLDAQVLTENFNPDALAETLTIGAMTAEAALSRFRRYRNKAVITGGDRTDIQLAALETPTVALILTGNLHPSPLIIQQAEALNVPVLLVNDNTLEAVETIERAYGRTRLGQPEKLETFIQLMVDNVNLQAIYDALGLS